MSNGIRKRLKDIETMVAKLGFELNRIQISKGDHICCHITDDVGNNFKAYTGQSCSANSKKARLNFRQDIRRLSNRMKGLIN